LDAHDGVVGGFKHEWPSSGRLQFVVAVAVTPNDCWATPADLAQTRNEYWVAAASPVIELDVDPVVVLTAGAPAQQELGGIAPVTRRMMKSLVVPAPEVQARLIWDEDAAVAVNADGFGTVTAAPPEIDQPAPPVSRERAAVAE